MFLTRTICRLKVNHAPAMLRSMDSGNSGMVHQFKRANSATRGTRKSQTNDLDSIKTTITTMDKDIKQTNDVLKVNLRLIRARANTLERENKKLNRKNEKLNRKNEKLKEKINKMKSKKESKSKSTK